MKKTMRYSNCPKLGVPTIGKVRDIYDLGKYLLIITTDRVSAFDVVMEECIPDKGRVLNQISILWFAFTSDIIPNHLISTNPDEYGKYCPEFNNEFIAYKDQLINRSVLVKKTDGLPVEAIVRGYISGSGWKSYCKNGTICGISLPEGLLESEKLPETLYTPSTKAEAGDHDENISFEKTVEIIGLKKAVQVKKVSLAIYEKCSTLAKQHGIIIADTKFEFGLDENGSLILIDEILTPDSSRFWPVETYAPGGTQPSMDKQPLRDWLETLDWNKKAPAPTLPDNVITETSERYLKALEAIESLV